MKRYLLMLLVFECSCNKLPDSDSIQNKDVIEEQKESNNTDTIDYYKLSNYQFQTSISRTMGSSGSYIVINKNELSQFENCELVFKDSFYLYRGSYFHFVNNRGSGFGFEKDTLVFDFLKYEGVSGYYYKVDEKVKCN